MKKIIFLLLSLILLTSLTSSYYIEETNEKSSHGYCGYKNGRPVDSYEIISIKNKANKLKIKRYYCGSRYTFQKSTFQEATDKSLIKSTKPNSFSTNKYKSSTLTHSSFGYYRQWKYQRNYWR